MSAINAINFAITIVAIHISHDVTTTKVISFFTADAVRRAAKRECSIEFVILFLFLFLLSFINDRNSWTQLRTQQSCAKSRAKTANGRERELDSQIDRENGMNARECNLH